MSSLHLTLSLALRAALISTTLLLSSTAGAATAFWEATINKLVVNPSTGLCAAWVVPGPEDQGLSLCNRRWVNFDCSGDFGPKSNGMNAWSMVQLALASGRSISINVNDSSRIDVGSTQYCLADQVQLKP